MQPVGRPRNNWMSQIKKDLGGHVNTNTPTNHPALNRKTWKQIEESVMSQYGTH